MVVDYLRQLDEPAALTDHELKWVDLRHLVTCRGVRVRDRRHAEVEEQLEVRASTRAASLTLQLQASFGDPPLDGALEGLVEVCPTSPAGAYELTII